MDPSPDNQWRMERVNALPDSFSVEIFCGPTRMFIHEIEGGSLNTHQRIQAATIAGQNLVDALTAFGA